MKTRNKHLALAALLIALGVVLPMIFHAFNLGKVFLPMFWPIALTAFLMPWRYALGVAVFTPLTSSLLTGMPPLSPPIAPITMLEGAALVSGESWGFHYWRIGTLAPLLFGLFVSRVVLYFFIALLAPMLGLPQHIAAIAKVLEGAPGIILILIIIPFLVNRLGGEPVVRLGRN